MKKKLSSLVSMLLVLVLSFSLVGCGGTTDEDRIVGTWIAELDMSSMMDEQLEPVDEQMPGLLDSMELSPIIFEITAEFNDDGTWTMSFDEDQLTEVMTTFGTEFGDGMTAYLKDELGLSDEDIENAFGGNLGETLVEEMDLESSIASLTTSQNGEYEIEDGTLYTAGDHEFFTYEFEDDDTLVLTEIGGDNAETLPDFVFPLTLVRE